MLKDLFSNVIIKFLPIILKNITPTLRKEIISFLDSLEQKAKQTSSPFDDLFIAFIRSLLDI
jgi:hypothetical protein